jgi:hypothetical protein
MKLLEMIGYNLKNYERKVKSRLAGVMISDGK